MHAHLSTFRLPLRTAALALLAAATFHPLATAAQPSAWGAVVQENGIPCVPLDSLRSFYKLSPLAVGGGKVGVSNGGFPIIFTPGTTKVSIGGYECQLVHPATRRDNGDLVISLTDAVKLFDPILRPTYITPRRIVRTIVIDPGHGGGDDGNCANDIREADLTLRTAIELRKALLARGYKVVLTRDQNRSLSDQRRVEIVRTADSPIYISLHANSGRSDISGIETYCMHPAGQGQPTRPGNACDAENIALAFCLHTSLVSASGAVDGGCRRTRYSLLSSVPCPAAMVELGYISNAEEAAQLATAEYPAKLAAAIADGVSTFAKALNPAAKIPSTTAPVDTTTPPTTYESEVITPRPPQQSTTSSNKGRKGGKSTPPKKNSKGRK